MPKHRFVVAAGALWLAACGSARPPEGGDASAPPTVCTSCHGDPNRAPVNAGDPTWPPVAPAPPVAFSDAGVGAHLSHLLGGPIRSPIRCTECHPYPTDTTHAGLALQFSWGTLATGNGATTPSFDATALTCANYCHGATLPGGSNTHPKWTVVDGSQMACGTCHGVPPPPPHPAVAQGDRTTCSRCHGGTVNADGTIATAGGLHVNGTLDFSGSGSCTGCHGDANRTPAEIAPAPPIDLSGSASASSPGVGAHQSHLQGKPIAPGVPSIRGPIACTDCHPYPTDLTHASQPLQFAWSALATGNGATAPSFDAATLQCSNYCHGATLSAGSNTRPTWNVVDGSQMACGTCHGLPPVRLRSGGLHFTQFSPGQPITRTDCWLCHTRTVNSAGDILTANGTHVDGQVQFNAPAR